MAAHRYFRLTNFAGYSNYVGLCEVKLSDSVSGTNRVGSGTASASSQYSGSYIPSYACDGNLANYWSSTAADAPLAWWQYDFGAGNAWDIIEVVLTAPAGAGYVYAPTSFSLLWSDDGATWSNEWSFTTAAWTTGNQVQTLDAPRSSPTVARWAGLAREVLRTTGTGGATYIAMDALAREVLRSAAQRAPGGPMVSIIM